MIDITFDFNTDSYGKDPFGTYDYTLEQERGEQYPRVRTLAFKKILTLAKLGSNVILTAPKGVGKSTILDEVAKELGDSCLAMVGFRTVADVYNYLWLKIWQKEKENIGCLIFGKKVLYASEKQES